MNALIAVLALVAVKFSLTCVLSGLLLTFLISVSVLTLSCALGWVVAKISLKLKNKSLITVIVSLAFFAGYYFVVFKAETLLSELLANVLVFGEAVKNTAYPLYLMGSVGVGDPVPCLVVTLAVAALFGLFLGLNMPNLSWTNETTVLKQSLGVMIAMFGGFAYTVAFILGFLLLPGWKLGFMGYMGCFVGINLLLSGALYLWLKKRGSELFAVL